MHFQSHKFFLIYISFPKFKKTKKKSSITIGQYDYMSIKQRLNIDLEIISKKLVVI
jgi:hypothetical protein